MKISFPSFLPLRESVLSNLSHRHKQILAIASIAFVLLATAYLVTRRYFFKATNVELRPLDAQDRISNKKEEIIGEEEDNKISKGNPQEINPFTSLPDELLIHIFSTLPIEEWKAISLTNQSFHNLSHHPQVIATLLENEKLIIPFNQYLKLAKQTGPDLKRFKLSHTAVTDQQLEDLVKACPYIEKLDLINTQITDNCLVHLASLASLQSLDLWGCKDITDAGLAHLTSLTSLQSLNLKECKKITIAGFNHFNNFAPQVNLIK